MGDGSTGPGKGGRPGPGQILGDIGLTGLGRTSNLGLASELGPTGDSGVRQRLRRTLARVLVRGTDTVIRWVVRLLGESHAAGRTQFSTAELRDLVKHSKVLDGEGRRLIDEVIAAGDRHVRELMVPRTDVVFLDGSATVADAAQRVRSARHSRFPVIEGTHDDVVGFVHLRDLLIRPEADTAGIVGELARPLRRLPASKRVLSALSEMRREGDHLALVVDEYGGTAGIVTLEDLLEELVGEITDEYDLTPEPDDDRVPSEVDGMLNLNDFAERTGVTLPTGPYDTVGGFVMASLGRLGQLGDQVLVAAPGTDWRLRVIAVDGRRVARVAVAPVPPAEAAAPDLVLPREELDAELVAAPAGRATER